MLPASSRAPLIMVFDRGSMKEVSEDGGAAKVNLAELKTTKHLYALGPLAKLRGEIVVWDSQPYEARAHAGNIQVKSDWNESAALLVWSSVPKWRKTRVPPSVMSRKGLESWLHSMSGALQSPLQSQYPFLLRGKFLHINWHIINVKDDGSPLSAEKLVSQQYHGDAANVRADILGFYSPDHQGIFIPEGQRTHLHVKVGSALVAHVDDFEPAESGLFLYVPTR